MRRGDMFEEDYVVVPGIEARAILYVSSPRLAHSEQAADFEKEVIEESSDGRRMTT